MEVSCCILPSIREDLFRANIANLDSCSLVFLALVFLLDFALSMEPDHFRQSLANSQSQMNPHTADRAAGSQMAMKKDKCCKIV